MNRRPNLIPAAVLIVIGLAVGGYGGFQLREASSLYQATAGVRVIRDQTDLAPLPESFPTGMSDSVFLQNQAEVIRSEAVLNKVVEKLGLNQEWGKEFGADTVLKTAESAALLRDRVAVSQQPGTAVLQITATARQPAQAQSLANALAAAFCEARWERRRRVSHEAVAKLDIPFRESKAKYEQAATNAAKARAALDPAIRHLDSPPPPTESDALRDLRQEMSRLTIILMVQSNQFAHSQSLPAEEQQKVAAQFNRLTNHVTEVETAIQTELQKQEALKIFRATQQELELAKDSFAPLQKAMIENRQALEATNNPPAIVAEPATTAVKSPVRNPVAFGCLIGAVGLLVCGAWLLGAGGKA